MSDLEQHLAQLPPLVDDPAYLVFADWLQSQGDPWGVLIALQYNAAHDPARREELELEAQYVLGEHRRTLLGEYPVEAVWHHGFLRSATLKLPAEHPVAIPLATKALLARPLARMLEKLVLAPGRALLTTMADWGAWDANVVDPWPDWDDLGPVLWDRATNTTRVPHLGFGAWPAKPVGAYTWMPSWDMIGRWFRDLRRLSIVGMPRATREHFDLPNLVELELRCADAGNETLSNLGASVLPMLECMTVSLGGSAHCIVDDVYPPDENGDYPLSLDGDDLEAMSIPGVRQDITREALTRFLDRIPPKVKDLSFASSYLMPEMILAIAEHARMPQLASLDLSACSITDQTITYVLDNAPALARIGRIDLSRNDLSSRWVSRIKRALPNAIIDVQGQRFPDFFMRYVATVE